MKPERWQKVDELFHAALECGSEVRGSFLARACNGDDELLSEVESMLSHHEEAKSFMESPAYVVEAQAIVDDASEGLNGNTVGSYQVLSELGRGGMGEVYLAFDKELQRKVALKFLHPDLAGDKRRVRRFQQEARAASALNHPNMLTVFEVGEIDGRQFIATEFVEGQTLREVMNFGGQISFEQIFEIAVQTASALTAAHMVGVVHRDIKPENIMIRRDGYIKIVDFGVAKLTEERSSDESESTCLKTEEGTAAGTVSYMSPEQIRLLDVDARTDIWSFSVVLYEMVEGRHPFQDETSGDMLANILRSEPPLLTRQTVDQLPELGLLIVKGLSKDRTRRYQTMEELLIDLRKLKSRWRRSRDIPVVKRGEKAFEVIASAALLALLITIGAKLISRTGQTSVSFNSALPTSTVAAKRTFAYALNVQKMRNGKPYDPPFQSYGDESFQNGWKFRLIFSSPESGFLYLLVESFDLTTRRDDDRHQHETTDEVSILYPEPSVGADLIQPNQSIQTDWYVFDQKSGTEKLWVIWSANAVPELERVRRFLNSRDRGSISETAYSRAIKDFLAAHSSTKPEIQRDTGKQQIIAKAEGDILTSSLELVHQ